MSMNWVEAERYMVNDLGRVRNERMIPGAYYFYAHARNSFALHAYNYVEGWHDVVISVDAERAANMRHWEAYHGS